LKILVAEDNPVNQEVAAGILESLDCDVTIVDNGAEALEFYRAAAPGQFDLILMDCQMPVMDGLEATRRIRDWESGKVHIPILALTANAFDGSRAECLEAGMDDMLNKPFRRQQLQEQMARMLERATPVKSVDPEPVQPAVVVNLDPKPLQVLRDLDPDGSKKLLERTLTKFADYGDDLLTKIVASAAECDLAEVSRLAHSLKSSSANMGAVDLSKQCQDIEKSANDGCEQDDLCNKVDHLAEAYQAAKAELLSITGR